MIKRILVTIILSLLVIAMLLKSLYDEPWLFINIVNISFIVAITMFFMGIIATTNITDVFTGFGYTFRKLFSGRVRHLSYLDYRNERKGKKHKATGFPLLFVGTIYLIVTIILSYTCFN